MNSIISFFRFCFVVVLLTYVRCSVPHVAGGGTIETTNGLVSGTIVFSSGSPGARAQVKLLPADYDYVKNTAPVAMDTTDSLGRYSFSKIASGDYFVLAVHLSKRTRLLHSGIHVAADTITFPADTLRPPGAMEVALPPGIDAATGYVYLPGTTLFSFLNDRTDAVVIDSVPAGDIPEVEYSATNSDVSKIIRYNVSVSSGDTAFVRMPLWKYARKLVLNTSGTGANVGGDVINFPVLIRLNSGNFDFSEIQATGADMRFTKQDNTALSFEIERCDPATEHAEVWVKADTVRGKDSTQSLMMYWGNATAADGSAPSAVFDTASGFAGVWHLGRPAGAIVPDATANAGNGTATATATVSGAIGMAQMFDGKSSLIQANGSAGGKLNFPENGTCSVSAWVNANAIDSSYHGIVYKSNFQYGLQINYKNSWEFFTFIDKTGWEGSPSPASIDSWHFLAGVRNGTRQYLYVDGTCMDSAKVLQTSNLSRVNDASLQIGHCPDGGLDPDRYFSGIIDEVRISSTANNADWIKLSYMNQKVQDVLVKW